METKRLVQALREQRPSYVVGANGQPTAVLLDIATWRAIIKHLEDLEDNDILQVVAADLESLAQGQRPTGWKSWNEFEAELDALEAAGELPA
jgi:hypothetical protein